MTLKIVDFSQESKPKIDPEISKTLLKHIEELKKAIEDDKLTEVVIQYSVELEERDKDGDIQEGVHTIFWNDSYNIDQLIGYIERMKLKILA